MIRVAIADDQQIILYGLKNILSSYPHVSLEGIYNGGAELLLGLTTVVPDILLLDIQMPGKDGIELAGIISKKYPSLKIIALTNVEVLVQVKKMLHQGCAGYLLKDTDPKVLLQAIETVYNGGLFLDEKIKQELVDNQFATNKASAKLVLSSREKGILKCIMEELSNQQIAEKLFISQRTVENHRNNLYQKLGVKNTVGLVKVVLKTGLF